jgi:hypothetical protein
MGVFGGRGVNIYGGEREYDNYGLVVKGNSVERQWESGSQGERTCGG